MDDLEQIIQIISQVPDLIDAAQTYKETNEKTVRALSSAIKQKPMAEVPQSEIAKLISQISQTKCAMPDAGELTDAIVKNITQIMTPIIQETVKDTIASMRIRLKQGQECWEIYTSGYVTEEEKKVMIKDFNGVSAYPEKYKDSPWALREKIRKNRSILKDRRKQARKNKGKYYIEENVGF